MSDFKYVRPEVSTYAENLSADIQKSYRYFFLVIGLLCIVQNNTISEL